MKRWMVAIGAGLWISALAPGLSVTAQAEWVEEDGESYFLDSSGNRVKSDWRTRDGISYYLDSEGNVATDTWIQNTYYVDAQGAMVKDSWVEEDGESGLKEAGWYYLGQNGKVEKDTWKTIENFRYSFDSDGKMRTGWHYEDGEVYYLGDPDEGFARTGWQFLEYSERNRPAEGEISRKLPEGDARGRWFYFQKTGKAKRSPEGSYEAETIDGRRYYFDANGMMRTGWHYEDGEVYYLGDPDEGFARTGWQFLEYSERSRPAEGEISRKLPEGDARGRWFYFQKTGKAKRSPEGSYEAETIDGRRYYFDANGMMCTGWLAVRDQVEPGDAVGISRFVYLGGRDEGVVRRQWMELTEHPWNSDSRSALTVSSGEYEGPEEGVTCRYYFKSDGTPAFLPKDAASLKQAVTEIDGESYLFDPYGCLQTGLVRVGESTGYFGPEGSDGAMRYGRVENVTDRLDRSFTCYFSTTGSDKGQGFTGEKDGALYWRGIMVTAKEGTEVQPFLVNGTVYLVNEAGRVQTNEKAYSSEGKYAYRIEDGTVYKTDEEGEKTEEVKTGKSLPAVSFAYVY